MGDVRHHHPQCPGGDRCTLELHDESDASIARALGCRVGTVLESRSGFRLRITAIGERSVLARGLSDEGLWSLYLRCWVVVEQPESEDNHGDGRRLLELASGYAESPREPCEVVRDRTWLGQYYCQAHCVWFRSEEEPYECPAGELATRTIRELVADMRAAVKEEA